MLHRKWKKCGDRTAGAYPTTPHPYQRPVREHTHTHTHIHVQRWNKPVKKKKKKKRKKKEKKRGGERRRQGVYGVDDGGKPFVK